MPLAKPVPPIRRAVPLDRGLPPGVAVDWLRAGWEDFRHVRPDASLFYGLLVMAVSMGIVLGLFLLRADYALFPALSAFMVVGPAIAIGLYEKSRALASGEEVSLRRMLFVSPRSRGQILYVGVLLVLMVFLWVRVAVLLYALFFGMHPFPGLDGIVTELFTTASGWGLLISGSLFGALFASLGFGLGALSIPMLLNERTDAFTAMGTSMALTWNNLPVMLAWGGIVLVMFAFCVFTLLFGLFIVFPVLGHATWHAYVAIRGEPDSPIFTPAVPEAEAL